ncbi:hypothetical protein [Actinomadura sp. WMMA1423]|uniref:hypothetical protein n=1 Tax=Actinomadura sp. WMMA1423 TaxID=2591108 RepID=UPI0034A2CEF9
MDGPGDLGAQRAGGRGVDLGEAGASSARPAKALATRNSARRVPSSGRNSASASARTREMGCRCSVPARMRASTLPRMDALTWLNACRSMSSLVRK